MWNLYPNKKERFYHLWFYIKNINNKFLRKKSEIFQIKNHKKFISKNSFLNFSDKDFSEFLRDWILEFKSERKRKIFYKLFSNEITKLVEKFDLHHINWILDFLYYFFKNDKNIFLNIANKFWGFLYFYYKSEKFTLQKIPWFSKKSEKIFLEIYNIPENTIFSGNEIEKWKNKDKKLEKIKILNPQTFNSSKKWWKKFLTRKNRKDSKNSLKKSIKKDNLENFSTIKMKKNKWFFD